MVITPELNPQLDQELISDLTQSVSSRIADFLERAILEGEYPPGYRLREVELAKQLRVSRTPLREAFHVLEMKGFIVLQPRRGAFVKTITIEVMESLLTVRVCMDGLAASLAAENAEPNDIARMREILTSQKKAHSNKDNSAYHVLGQEFHKLVYAASKNPKLISIYQTLQVECALYPVADIMLPGEMEKSIQEHQGLLEAISYSDALKAKTIAERHIDRVRTHLKENLPDGSEATKAPAVRGLTGASA